jgi:hypothetical protein
MDCFGHVAVSDYGTCKELHTHKEVNLMSTLSVN